MNLMSVKTLAKNLDISERQAWKMLSSGRLPKPLRLGRSVKWREQDIREWISLGCPSCEEFEARQAVGAAR